MAIISIRKVIALVQIWILLNEYLVQSQTTLPFNQLPLPGAVGPEDTAFDLPGGGPYTGVADGRILKYENGNFVNFATTSPFRIKEVCDGTNSPILQKLCGRPLGLVFHNATGNLYIADAYFGLMVVGAGGGQATLVVKSYNGWPFYFINALDIDQVKGYICFVTSGHSFYSGNLAIIANSGDRTGSLFKYDIATQKLTQLATGLSGPAGVALAQDNSYVLFTEFIGRRIIKFFLEGPNANSSQVLLNVTGNPDNIKRTQSGDFWIAVIDMSQQPTNSTGLRIDGSGQVLETFNVTPQFRNGITEVREYNGSRYIGSQTEPFVGLYTM